MISNTHRLLEVIERCVFHNPLAQSSVNKLMIQQHHRLDAQDLDFIEVELVVSNVTLQV